MARVNISRAAKIRTAQRLTVPVVAQATGEIEHFSRAMAPRGTHMSGSGRRRPGPPLAATVKGSLRIGTEMVVGRVGSGKKYAATAHQGSSPHVIRARGRLLKFRWERGNLLLEHRGRGRREFFYFRSVMHPGNKRPVRYLTTPLSLVARRHGFLVFGVGRGRRRLP